MSKQFEFLDVIEQYEKMEKYFKEHCPMEYQAYRNSNGLEMPTTKLNQLELSLEMERSYA